MQISEKEFEELKVLYEKALEENNVEFLFKEQELLVDYAKYLIEHLENEMKNQ